jgi:hypothetical protein
MTNKNPHIGSTFESWLDEKGIREDVTAAAEASSSESSTPMFVKSEICVINSGPPG